MCVCVCVRACVWVCFIQMSCQDFPTLLSGFVELCAAVSMPAARENKMTELFMDPSPYPGLLAAKKDIAEITRACGGVCGGVGGWSLTDIDTQC